MDRNPYQAPAKISTADRSESIPRRFFSHGIGILATGLGLAACMIFYRLPGLNPTIIGGEALGRIIAILLALMASCTVVCTFTLVMAIRSKRWIRLLYCLPGVIFILMMMVHSMAS